MNTLKYDPDNKDHKAGQLDAPVILLEYGDYECPHSAKASLWIEQLLKEFRGNICYIYRHFPLVDIHPHSALGALSAEAAALKGKFWEMHQILFDNYFQLSTDTILAIAEKLKLNQEEFLHALDSDDLADRVSRDLLSGEESGVTSPPAFFLNGIRMEGPISLEILRSNIINLLNGKNMMA